MAAKAQNTITSRKVTYDASGKIISCLFCNILDGKEPGDIILSNNKYFVFRNKFPVTKNHLLVSPKEHIQNFNILKGNDGAVMVNEMMDIGNEAIATLNHKEKHDIKGKATYKSPTTEELEILQCFHVPPTNSVDHLHLHVIPNPKSMSYFNYMKYLTNTRWCITGDRAIELLKASE